MREKPTIAIDYSRNSGITPACAGKTALLIALVPLRWDHPRVCGKNFVAVLANEFGKGSPPRVREKHDKKP